MRWALAIALLAVLLLLGLLVARESRSRSGHQGSDATERAAADVALADPGALDDSGPDPTDPATVVGVVVNEKDVPVAGATLSYEPDAGPAVTATTDARGRFALAARRRRGMGLVVRHPDYCPVHDSVDADDAEPLRIVIRRGAPLTVVVRGPDGPVEGAAVEACARAPALLDPDFYRAFDLDDAVTDAKGEADLGHVPGGGWVEVRVWKRGFAPVEDSFDLRGGVAHTVEVTLGPGGAIEGTVTAPDGTAVQGARLHDQGGDEVLATTDAFGRYRIGAVGASGIAPVAEADGYGPGGLGDGLGWGEPIRVHVMPNEVVSNVDIVLGKESRIRGRIVDKQGQPVAGVEVSVEVDNGVVHSDTAITGEDGKFEVGPIAAHKGTTFSLEFEKKNLTFFAMPRIWRRSLAPGQDVDVGKVRASPKASITGTVFDIDGSLLSEGYVSTGSKRAPVCDGVFLIEGVYAVEHEVVAYGFGPARPRSRPVSVRPRDGQRAEVELRLVETLAISGHVVDAGGKPREGVWLRAIPAKTDEPDQLGVIDATGKDGSFELPGLLPGKYRVGIKRDAGYGWAFLADPKPLLVEAGTRNVEIRLPFRGGTLRGRVIAKDSRLPLREFYVTLYERFLFLPRYKDEWRFEDEHGAFRIQTPGPGTYFVDVWADGYAECRTEAVEVGAGKTVDLGTIPLGAPGSIHGKVQDHEGQPVAWCRVYVLSRKLEWNPDPPFTDSNGRYDIRGLSPGTYTLFAVSPRHPLAIRREIEVGEGSRVRVNVDMAASAPLVLRIVNEQGRPVPGAKLVWTFPDLKPLDSSMVADREPPGFGANVADEAGVIRKPFLPAGDLEVRVAAKGFAPVVRTITLRAGEKQTVEIRLKEK